MAVTEICLSRIHQPWTRSADDKKQAVGASSNDKNVNAPVSDGGNGKDITKNDDHHQIHV